MAEQTKLDTQIVEVTVFLDGARVVRRGRVSLEAGTRTVVLAGLPASVDPASVRVVAAWRRHRAARRRGPPRLSHRAVACGHGAVAGRCRPVP